MTKAPADTLNDITSLPSDVARRTIKYRAGEVQQAYPIAHSWLGVIESLPPDCPLQIQTFAVYESFDASLFNAVTGWYRTAGLTLRAGVDDLLTGLYYQMNGDRVKFRAIITGIEGTKRFREMREALLKATSDSKLFGYPGDLANLYDTLSIYTHRIAHGELWSSNGPIFTDKGFDRWFTEFVHADTVLRAAVEAGRKFV